MSLTASIASSIGRLFGTTRAERHWSQEVSGMAAEIHRPGWYDLFALLTVAYFIAARPSRREVST